MPRPAPERVQERRRWRHLGPGVRRAPGRRPDRGRRSPAGPRRSTPAPIRRLFRSADGAAHWTATRPAPPRLPVSALLATPAAVYVNVVSDSPAPVAIGYLFRSTDHGASWSPLGTGGFVVTALAADPAESRRPLRGLPRGGVPERRRRIDLDRRERRTAGRRGRHRPAGAGAAVRVYAALTKGAKVFRSTDGGSHWQRVSRGITSPALTAFAAGPNPAVLYVAANAGTRRLGLALPYRWTVAPTGSGRTRASPPIIQALVLDPRSPALFAGSRTAGVFRSVDGAATWKTASHGLRAVPADAVVADPKRSAILFAGTPDFGLIKTVDGGASWQVLGAGAGARKPLAIDPRQPATVYARSQDGDVLRSRNGGRSWQVIESLLYGVSAFAIDPNDPEILYASGPTRIDRSTDGGDTWTLDFTSSCVSPAFLAITPTSRVFNGSFSACGPNEVGIGIHERGPNGGWGEANNGLPIRPSPDGSGRRSPEAVDAVRGDRRLPAGS